MSKTIEGAGHAVTFRCPSNPRTPWQHRDFRWRLLAAGRSGRNKVERICRRALDRAVGVLSRHVTWAALGIVKLAGNAESEAVKLSALRAIYSEMIAASRFGDLDDRVTELEEWASEDAGNAS